MSPSLEVSETPPELEDVLARVSRAQECYVSLAQEMDRFLYCYVEGMVKGRDSETGNFTLQLGHPRESVVKGRPRLLVAEIVENLRSALDYMVFQLSVRNEPELSERVPQFVISSNKADFKRQAKSRLRYLTDEQKGFVEQMQPYRGNLLLGLLGDMAGSSKHRKLLSIRDNTGLDIYFAEMAKNMIFRAFSSIRCKKGTRYSQGPRETA